MYQPNNDISVNKKSPGFPGLFFYIYFDLNIKFYEKNIPLDYHLLLIWFDSNTWIGSGYVLANGRLP
jgi:hypothetical protein